MSAASAPAARRSGPSGGPASGGRRMKSKRVQAVVLAAALAVGYAGAAVYSAMAAPSLPIITDFGPGDGLTRFVLTAQNDVATPDLVHSLESVDGVVRLAGIAPDVTIRPLVIGGGSNVSVTAGAEVIRYAVDHGLTSSTPPGADGPAGRLWMRSGRRLPMPPTTASSS